ncbi:MAG: FAD-binding oxidoreductase [Planctomycetaceae bacterium]
MDPGEFQPTSQGELARWLQDNAAGARRGVVPVGGRTALWYGHAPVGPGVAVSTTRLERVVDYPARDMTITVEAGLTIEKLEQLLASEGQRLGLDCPAPARATIGGVLATNTSGPRRFGLGTARDLLLGLTAIDAGGAVFHAGGRVVKNVAGYDLCKLLVGSLGTLAVLTQVTLKLRPRPECSHLLWWPVASLPLASTLLARLSRSAARPVAIEWLNARAIAEVRQSTGAAWPEGSGGALCLGVEGTQREVDWQVQTLRDELLSAGGASSRPVDVVEIVAEAPGAWTALTELQVPSDEALTLKATVPPSRLPSLFELATRRDCPVACHAGTGVAWIRAPEELATAAEAAELIQQLRRHSTDLGGHLSVVNCQAAWKSGLDLWGSSAGGWHLMRQLKQRLDPHGLLNRGRLFGDV